MISVSRLCVSRLCARNNTLAVVPTTEDTWTSNSFHQICRLDQTSHQLIDGLKYSQCTVAPTNAHSKK